MTTLYIAMDHEVVTVSEANGAWQMSTPLDGLNPQSLAVDPRQPERLFCGTSRHGLHVSEDAGASWRPLDAGPQLTNVKALAVSPEDGSIYAGTEPSAVFRSEEGGKRWYELTGLTDLSSATEWSFPPRPETHHVRFIAIDPTRPEHLYVCIEAGALVRSPNRGDDWTDRVPSGPIDTHTLATHPGAPGRVYSAAGDGYFESIDFGQTWTPREDGLDRRYMWSVAVDVNDPDTVLASAAHGARQAHDVSQANSAIYRRTGNGAWQQCHSGLPAPEGATAYSLVAGAEPGAFFAVNNFGVYRTDDAGENWEQLAIDWPSQFRTQRPQALIATHDRDRG